MISISTCQFSIEAPHWRSGWNGDSGVWVEAQGADLELQFMYKGLLDLLSQGFSCQMWFNVTSCSVLRRFKL